MLWSAILFIWEFVCVDLEKAKEAGGNFGTIISAIKSPQAIPWALLILVIYFLFKVVVEWHQCSRERRGIRASRIDYSSAWVVALSALVLYGGQTLARVQFADLLKNSSKFRSFLSGTVAAGGIVTAIVMFRFARRFQARFPRVLGWLMMPISILLVALNLVDLIGRRDSLLYLPVGVLVGGLSLGVLMFWLEKQRAKRTRIRGTVK